MILVTTAMCLYIQSLQSLSATQCLSKHMLSRSLAMAHFATPFLVVNLGCEILYVIDQRLKAQQIPVDKSERVMTDITSVLLNEKLLDEVFAPQPVATHGVVRQLLLDISAASIMRLDDYSAGKLWELATMIYKWQLAAAPDKNIFDITRRHLQGVAALLPQYYPRTVLNRARKRFDTLGGKLSAVDFENLNCALLLWVTEYRTKISVLLRLGLQNKDGKFCPPVHVDPKILDNLGENIYNYDTKKEGTKDQQPSIDTSEISCLLSQIAGTAQAGNSVIELKLPFEFGECSSNKSRVKVLEIQRNTQFQDIDINVRNRTEDLLFNPQLPKSTQEDLLAMMEVELYD